MGKKSKPLVIVATKNTSQKVLESYKLRKFKGVGNVSYITNDLNEGHISPFTGKKVSNSSGVSVANTIQEKECFGNRCGSCGAVSVSPTAQINANVKHCIVCSESMHVTEEQLEDVKKHNIGGDDIEDPQDDIEDDIEDLEDDIEDLEEDLEDDDDDEEDSSNDVDAEMNMTDIVDEDGDLKMVDIDEDTVAAFVDGVHVATKKIDSNKSEIASVHGAGYISGLRTVIQRHGLHTAMTSAGFDPVTITAPGVIANSFKTIEKKSTALALDKFEAQKERMTRCMDLAAAGSVCGLFTKKDALLASITDMLRTLKVENPKTAARRALASSIAQHNKEIIEIAEGLVEKDDSALDTLDESITNMMPKMEMNPETVEDIEVEEENEVEEDLSCGDKTEDANITARLLRPVVTASKTQNTPKLNLISAR